jgi:hypothetical protein
MWVSFPGFSHQPAGNICSAQPWTSLDVGLHIHIYICRIRLIPDLPETDEDGLKGSRRIPIHVYDVTILRISSY